MGNRNTLNPFYPTIHLTLDNTIFSMQANFLVSDYTTLQNLRESNNGLISDYRQAFAFILPHVSPLLLVHILRNPKSLKLMIAVYFLLLILF